MIDASEILPKGIQQDYRDVKGLVRVNYNGRKYIRVFPYVVYEDDGGQTFQFKKATWVECELERSYGVKLLDGSVAWLEYDRMFDKHSVSDVRYHREWKELGEFLTEDKDGTCQNKHLQLDVIGLFAKKGYNVKIVAQVHGAHKLYINETLVPRRPLYDYEDCLKDATYVEDVELQYAYGKSIDELSCMVDTIEKAIEKVSGKNEWRTLYDKAVAGEVDFDTFVKTIRGES